MNVRYRVELSQAERGERTTMLSKRKRAARTLTPESRPLPSPILSGSEQGGAVFFITCKFSVDTF
jgi:hypothetical protein